MKSRSFWAVLCLFALFALPAVAQDWVQKQMISLPTQSFSSEQSHILYQNGNLFVSGNSSFGSQVSTVYIFKNENDTWVLKDSLNSLAGNSQGFGKSMSFYNDYGVIGSNSGVFVFKKLNNSWQQHQFLPLPNNQNIDICIISPFEFAKQILMHEDLIFVNSIEEQCGSAYNGALYVYKKGINGEWTLFKKIKRLNTSNLINFSERFELKHGKLFIFAYECYEYLLSDVLNSDSNILYQPDFYPSMPIDKMSFSFVFPNVRSKTNDLLMTSGYWLPNNYIQTHEFKNNMWKRIGFNEMPKYNGDGSIPSQHHGIVHTDKFFIKTPAYDGSIIDWKSVQIYKKFANRWFLDKRATLNNFLNNARIAYPVEIGNDQNIFANVIENEGTFSQKRYIVHFQKTRGNLIKGKVYHDVNANCQKEAGEVGKEYSIIKAEPGGYITSTDENGNYELEVGAGTYTISQVIPQAKGLQVTQLCPAGAGTHTVSFTGLNNEVSGYDFGNDVKECTFLTVDVTARRRRCFRNQTIVKYENEGVAVANNAYITVTFPEYVIPLSSTNPWVSKEGNTYKFNIGTLQAGQSGQFIVTDSVACVAGIQGLIQCTEAKIYQKNTCAAPTWNGASLEITSQCLDVVPHKGRFVLRNTGTASMQSAYKVWRGNTLILNNLLTLAQGDSLVLEIPTNGENLFIQANQATGHPDGETLSAMVMNCGSNLITSPNLQMVIMPNDEYANSELDCVPIVDSFDPNDKAVSPIGITENNYVKPNTELEYKIRFQNMGTAEAVNIVVVDTLSQHLDLTTFQMMSASHTYKLKFERVNDKQVAFWTFTDINLPAKSVNEPASHGYIKFKIKHLPTIAEGTIIKNFADIYFDYNEPVRTNETAINMTDYQFPVNPVDYCSLFTQAQAGQARTICGDSYTLEGNLPTMGQGTWTRISGAGEIAETHKPNAIVTNLGVGENVFRWTLAGVSDCANTQSQVTIKRLPNATVSISNNTSNNIACAEENITFSAQVNNAGNAPIYQWKVNNQNVGTNSPTFSTNTLQNQDKVSVEIQTNLACNNAPKIVSQAIEITIKAKPAKPIIAHTALYELKASVEGDSYAWYKDNVLLTNNLPTLKVQKLGKYKVVVTQNGCASSASDEFVLNSEALKRFENLVKVETYPNPTTGKFTLNITNNQGSAIDIQIYDSVGKLITEQKVEASEDIDCKVAIDLTNYKQGVYYVQISNQQGLKTTHKIVVQKQ